MTEDNSSPTDYTIPPALQQRLPRKTRTAADTAFYLVGPTLISALILTFAVMVLLRTAKQVSVGKELATDGIVAYTGDVQSGGKGLATVYYSFTFNGNTYRGEALLPHRYLNRINDYSKSGNFPVLFLPGDPSINHPRDWHDDESYSSAFIAYLLIAILIVFWFAIGRFILESIHPER
jgi:hypothetical protein